MVTGRPATFATAEELQEAIDKIFNKYEADGYNVNMTLLTAELGFSSRSSIDDYMKRNADFSNIIKRTKQKIAGLKIMKAENNEVNSTMAIFDLKCNHEFDDKKAEKESENDLIEFEFVEFNDEN